MTLDDVTALFTRMRDLKTLGDATYDIDADCRWSYFFKGASRDRLTALAHLFDDEGYVVVGLLEPALDDADQETLFLRVDRVETHTIESLDLRNRQFEAFAKVAEISGYHGPQAAPVDLS